MRASLEVTMTATASSSPSSLPSSALARRLTELCRAERNLQADFLLHLAEFDARRGHLEAGYGSLWAYCLEALHLRESAAGRRTRAMHLLRKFPRVEAALRDGRLCLSTLCMLGPLLTDANLDDLVARAAFLSRADTEKLVVSLQPRPAPRNGVRRLPSVAQFQLAGGTAASSPARALAADGAQAAASGGAFATEAPAFVASPPLAAIAEGTADVLTERVPAADDPPPAPLTERRDTPSELRPIAKDRYSLRVTVDEAFKADLEELAALTSHTSDARDLAALLREGLRCAIAKHGKRRGAVEPTRKRAKPLPEAAANVPAKPVRSNEEGPPAAAKQPPAAAEVSPAAAVASPAASKPLDPRAIPMDVRRAVWKRDGGRCAWTSADGRRCGSRYKLELDHLRPVSLGGLSTLGVACKPHNIHEAFRLLGFETMAPHLGESATPGGSDES
jgi:hypothetical protein